MTYIILRLLIAAILIINLIVAIYDIRDTLNKYDYTVHDLIITLLWLLFGVPMIMIVAFVNFIHKIGHTKFGKIVLIKKKV